MVKRNDKAVALIFPSFVATVNLSACSVGRDYRRPNTAGLVQEAFDAQSESRFRAKQPIAAWWEKFDDDQLSRLMSEALDHNHDMRRSISTRLKHIKRRAIGRQPRPA